MDDLRHRALRAYEWARLRRAAPWALPAVLLSSASVALGGTWAPTVGVVLGVVSVGFVWRGRALGRGVLPGWLAGGLAWAVPVLWSCGDAGCSATCTSWCTAVAALGGTAAGVFLWRRVGRTSALAALVVASLAATMSCAAVGSSALAAVVALTLAGAPAVARQPQPA